MNGLTTPPRTAVAFAFFSDTNITVGHKGTRMCGQTAYDCYTVTPPTIFNIWSTVSSNWPQL